LLSAVNPKTGYALNMACLPLIPSDTHIVPVLIGDPQKCKVASDHLVSRAWFSYREGFEITVPGDERRAYVRRCATSEVSIDNDAGFKVVIWSISAPASAKDAEDAYV
jgi:5-aminolevulinate synthase